MVVVTFSALFAVDQVLSIVRCTVPRLWEMRIWSWSMISNVIAGLSCQHTGSVTLPIVEAAGLVGLGER